MPVISMFYGLIIRMLWAVSGFVAWPHGQDFSPDTLYLKSMLIAPDSHNGKSLCK